MKTKAASKIAKKTSAAKKASAWKSAAKPQASKKVAKPAQKAAGPAIEATPASGSPSKPEGKGATIMRLIARDQGATLPEIMSATGWLPHSVRGFISTASKKRGIESVRDEAGQRCYRLVE